MKVSAHFAAKRPGSESYSSDGWALTIEVEPPPEIQEDREKLRRYVQALFQECRERVEEHLAQHQEPSRSNGNTIGASHRRRQFDAPRRPRATTAAATNGRNGQSGATTVASPKQLNFVRALSRDAGMSYEDLGDMAFQAFGVDDVRSLTKRQASQLIDDLRGPDRS